LDVFPEFGDMAILLKCMWYSAVMFYVEIFYACLVGELFEDVTSISKLFIMIA